MRMRTQEDFPAFGEPDDQANFEEVQRGLAVTEEEWVLMNRGLNVDGWQKHRRKRRRRHCRDRRNPHARLLRRMAAPDERRSQVSQKIQDYSDTSSWSYHVDESFYADLDRFAERAPGRLAGCQCPHRTARPRPSWPMRRA